MALLRFILRSYQDEEHQLTDIHGYTGRQDTGAGVQAGFCPLDLSSHVVFVSFKFLVYK